MEENKNIQNVQGKPPVRENKMGYMPIRKLLISMSWPAILSMTINALYNVVDSIFVSWLSEDSFTAVSIILPLQMMIIAVSVGSGVGVNSLIARRLGAKQQDQADLAASTGIVIAMVNYLIFLFIGVFVAKPFVGLYAAKGSFIYNQAVTYLQIVCIFSAFIHFEIIIEKILQATGNMKAPMICATTGAVTNIILDPLLIFGIGFFPEMGVAGAAAATVIGQAASLVLGVTILLKGEHLLTISLRGFRIDWTIVKDIYKVGLPSIVMQSITSVMNIFYNMILVSFSTTAVAVFGIYGKLQSFIFMPVFGMNQGAMPIIGFNFGARNKERVMEGYKEGIKIAMIIMAIGVLIFQVFPVQLLGIFDASEEMLAMGVPALRIISINFIPAAFGIMTGTVFQATGHGVYSLICSFLRQMVFILPAAYILASIGGVALSWWSFPISEVAGFLYSALVMRWLYKREIATL